MSRAKESKINSRLRFSILLSLTLGLAPFYPEPHIIGKLRWIAGGGHGMQGMDYFDLIFHGTPWFLLIYFSMLKLRYLYLSKKG